MAGSAARPLGIGRFALAESPVMTSDGLVFVDLEGHALHRLDPAARTLASWSYALPVCCAVPARSGGLLVALAERVEHLDPADVRTVISVDVPPGVRLNDGSCDPRGRFFVGSCGYEREPGRGALHRLHGERLVPVLDGLTLPNGLGWSPDGDRLYLADSVRRVVLVHAYDLERGEVGPLRDTLDTSAVSGYPDGLTVDSDGRLWVAFWGGGAVRCLDPDGNVRHEVRVSAAATTSCAFLAPGKLVVTTGTGGPDPAGDLFVADVPAAGLPQHSWTPAPP